MDISEGEKKFVENYSNLRSEITVALQEAKRIIIVKI